MGDDFTADEKAKVAAIQRLPVTTAGIGGVEGPPAAPPGTTPEQLLKPTRDVEGELYVEFGKVRVDRSCVPEFIKAQQYLAKSPEGLNALNAVVNGKEQLTVMRTDDQDDIFTPQDRHGRGAVVWWDPNSATLLPNGSRQSAAFALLHETGHAIEYERNPERFERQTKTGNMRYGDAEEQRNISSFETVAAAHLPHEGRRTSHAGTAYRTDGPTSFAATGQELGSEIALRDALHAGRFTLASNGYNPPPLPGNDDGAVGKWDGKAHVGGIVHLDGNHVAQSIGRGKYQVYDIEKDLHGVVPPENNPNVTISEKGQVITRAPEHAHAQAR